MPAVIKLVKGEVYFRAGFYDPELLIPSIYSYVYEGYDEKDGYKFIDAETHMEKVRGEELTEGSHYICFPEGAVATMLDKKNLIKWLQDEHDLTKIGESYEYHAV